MEDLAYSIVPPLQRWFSKLKLINSTFFRAELVANYELLTIPDRPFRRIRDPSRTLIKSIHDIEWPFLRVTVPSKAFAIIPHLAIVAHEIGHALFRKIPWNLRSFNLAEVPPLMDRIRKRLNVATLDTNTRKVLNRVFQSWLSELSADAFAFYLTGPAIFFSLSEFSQFLTRSYGLSETHPANDLRRAILFAKLADGGDKSFAAIFKKHTRHILTEDFNSPLIRPTPASDNIYHDRLAAGSAPENAAVLSELHQTISRLVETVYAHVHTYLQSNAPDAIYSADIYDNDLTDHLLPMLDAIPPIESGSDLDTRAPTEFSSILNVGWAVLLTKLPELRVKTSRPDRFLSARLESLQGLLFKAVELSEAKRSWQGP